MTIKIQTDLLVKNYEKQLEEINKILILTCG